MASKLCDSCKSATATLFCRADSAFLCVNCDSKVHAANKVASRHARVWVCEVCEQAPAHVTCKADAAALCVTCDRDIHSANPLARRHERIPVTPLYDSVKQNHNFLDERYLTETETETETDDVSREEAEAASWLLPNPNPNQKAVDVNTGHYIFHEMDPYLDLEVDPKMEMEADDHNCSGTDGVVPVQIRAPILNDNCFDIDFAGPKPMAYEFSSHSMSSSSMEVGVVPDISKPFVRNGEAAVQLSAVDREARVMRYREKRKNRKFEKTIRYASRKAYAEMRPRIKGRFAKRSDIQGDVSIYGFGVVPSY